MLQQERRIYLIKELLKEQQEKIKIPKTSTLQNNYYEHYSIFDFPKKHLMNF